MQDKELTKLVCSWQLPGNNVKRHNFTNQEFMTKRSKEWLSIKNRLLNRYRCCPEMLPFLNEICRENPRYRSEQLSAVERYLGEKKPSTEILNAVLHNPTRPANLILVKKYFRNILFDSLYYIRRNPLSCK